MRIWSLHPRYLDTRGLVALWRETLLAQAVLRGRTKGYTQHPQLARFRAQGKPVAAIASYLREVHHEAHARGYRFAADKIDASRARQRMTVTRGQLTLEWRHLMAKLRVRDPARANALAMLRRPRAHPIFRVVAGDVATWEKTATPPRKNGVLR